MNNSKVQRPNGFRVSFAIILSALLSTTATAASIDYYVIQGQSEPLQIQEDGENHRGIVTDIVQKALKGSKYQLNIHTYPFNRMIAELAKNQQANWVTYGSPLWGDMQAANLSEYPILEVEHSILSGAKSEFDYQTTDDLEDKVAILLFGFDYPGLDKKIQSGDVSEIRVKNYDSALRVVDRLKGTGGFVEMDLRLQYHLKQLGFTREDYKLQKINNMIPNYQIHIAFSPGIDPEIKAYIDDRIKEMKDNNELQEIVANYL
ncbi:amino acid ABC transporter [Enterovibrio sp. ZSDZ35]|uniref:Amino acid ABC transporter n=1 Tax=Enterovibrio qingdaonensis TaxID=2899818 RepID=A0ABT5QRN4_9GAMM|nr:amino acid ABC transporter [Enterovibrio sp. ZSDZ35]MDD1783150.1 amino acid ABC transporter [Enterovibrio sp. ZSDZ35]